MNRVDFPPLSRSLGILLPLLLLVSSAFAGGPTLKVLYRFQGLNDGDNPYGNLIADHAGNLYGTTEYGGVNGYYGTVFELAPPTKAGGSWKETTLYAFGNRGDGARPTDGLIFDNRGNLYGTTSDSNAGGYGEVFQLTPPTTEGGSWTETVLYHFQGLTDGAYPVGGLIADAAGNLYGATASSVFELTPPAESDRAWTFRLLHEFKSGTADGWSSRTGLVRDPSGNLYGTTLWGGYEGNPNCGSIGCGTVFEVSPPAVKGGAWTEQVIHAFGKGSDSFDPESGLALDAAGNLYGTTYSGGTLGGGTVFRLSPPSQSGEAWTEQIIHDFGYTISDGAAPVATLMLDQWGNLYGTTMFGGTPCYFNGADYGCGVVFELSPVNGGSFWNETILYFLPRARAKPRHPTASLLFDAEGNLYGTTVYGGIDRCTADGPSGCGTVFEIER